MHFLANENFPLDAVESLRAAGHAGHDVAWIRSDAPGSSDPEVLMRAVDERRGLLPFDKDFGALAFHSDLPATCGIILFRLPMTSSADLARMVSAAIESGYQWSGHFSTVERGRIRIRKLPDSTPPDGSDG